MPLGYARGSTTVTGYNTQTEWGPTGVGVASDRVMFTVDLLGGTCFGTFDGKGDILGFNETSGFYFIQGTGY